MYVDEFSQNSFSLSDLLPPPPLPIRQYEFYPNILSNFVGSSVRGQNFRRNQVHHILIKNNEDFGTKGNPSGGFILADVLLLMRE